MLKSAKRKSEKTGLPPGALVHIGDRKTEKTKITIMDYDEKHTTIREVGKVEECLSFAKTPTVTWINVEGIHEVEILEQLGDCFGLHPLVMEDILNTEHRPKMADYEDYIYVVLKMHYYNDNTDQIDAEQVSLVLGPNFVLSFQESEPDVFQVVRERVSRGKGRIRKMGADYLAYALLDTIVDSYFTILEKLGENIEALEQQLIANPTPETLYTIHHLKSEITFLRKSVWPLREVISGLERGESALVKDTTELYLRDVYDHIIQVIDTVEAFRDVLSGMLDIYLSSVSNKTNEVMKVLTIIATIFIPLTFVAGIYGMNFKYMPELEWPWAYPIVWAVMFGIAIVMLNYFRRKKWL